VQPSGEPFVERLEPTRHLPDRLIRKSLRRPANLRDFLGSAVPHLADGFLYERARLIDREIPLEDWRRREADLPFEIPYALGEGEARALVLVVIEHQSDTDLLMPLRMLLFATGYWGRQWEHWAVSPRPRPRLRLHPVLPLVLYTGATPWGSSESLTDLMGEPAAFHAFGPEWKPVIWNLADRAPEALLNSGAPWLQLLAALRADREESGPYLALVHEVGVRLAPLASQDEVRWAELIEMLLAYTTWRRPLAEREALVEAVVRASSGQEQRVRAMANTAAEELMEQGRTEGERKGRAAGVQALRTVLLELLADRFGTVPQAVVERINALAELDRLEAAARQALRLQRLEDLQL
jgi:hypothetical protein